ncbi:lipid kinase [Listeria floridensis FSL S10-1187]|uniref:Lipid kinase n=1 Tax=Listeria floridensis FSL S10-1187 TaxID=1265817 RepID=A0ABN0RFZ6_9LIST|nr:diacylglycerol kinase [Listeria floridensis]EUJ32730.1 lipid kinase [Listeria floridensis FSL S10-1187]
MLKTAMLIYNPAAGQNKFRKIMPKVEKLLLEAEYDVTLVSSTEEPKSITKIAKEASDRGFDAIIAAGGDGTVNEVVNGIMLSSKRPVLGILPVGTTNDYARALGFHFDPLVAAKQIADRKTVQVDVGCCNGCEYFINNAAVGRITEITYAVPEAEKKRYGRLAYLFNGLKALPNLKPANVSLEFDGEHFEGSILLGFINNSHTVGGLESLVKKAEISDGYFDMIVLKKVSPAKLFSLFLLLKRGKHLESPDVIYRRVKKVKIDAAQPLNVSYDGVYGGKTPYEIENLHQALSVFADVHALKSNQF